jgi:hypothetical protein
MLGTAIIQAKMKNNIAPGDDKVTADMIKAVGPIEMQWMYGILKKI